MTPLFDRVPTPGPITSPFGAADGAHPEGHSGVDIGAPEGTEIVAPGPGRVRFISSGGAPDWWAPTFGNSVILTHPDGFVSLYAHMAFPPFVAIGQLVSPGDLLGVVGNTGYSFGPHLHWGLAPETNPWLQRQGQGGLLDPLLHIAQPPPPSPVIMPEPPFRYVYVGYDPATWTHKWEIRIKRKQKGQFQATLPPYADGDEEVYPFTAQDWE